MDTLEFIPLALASCGEIMFDWYNDGNSNNESVKISVRFLSNEIRSDALAIKVLHKMFHQENCKVTDRSEELSKQLTEKILGQAAIYEKTNRSKRKKIY